MLSLLAALDGKTRRGGKNYASQTRLHNRHFMMNDVFDTFCRRSTFQKIENKIFQLKFKISVFSAGKKLFGTKQHSGKLQVSNHDLFTGSFINVHNRSIALCFC